jgi:hypothetical protein
MPIVVAHALCWLLSGVALRPEVAVASSAWSVTARAPLAHEVSAVRIERRGDERSGTLRASVDGNEVAIAPNAIRAWISADRGSVFYSTPEGGGGYENEGESLWRYDANPGRRRQLMAAYFAIDDVIEQDVGARATALVVTMHDSGLGASHTAVVDAARGEVFLYRKSKLVAVSAGRITLALYDDDDWSELAQGRGIAPRRTVSYDLARLLRAPARIRKHVGPPST